ncbi:MAG: hypothetical protein AB7V27_09910 [Candidatus Binatia bacterium]
MFATVLVTNDAIMGMPLMGDLVPPREIGIAVPAAAPRVRVHSGSLGAGGDPFCPEAVRGSIFTLIFNSAIPVIALAWASRRSWLMARRTWPSSWPAARRR